MPAGVLRRASVRTALLTAALAIVALGVTVAWLVSHGWQPLTVRPVETCLLAVAFFLAEQNLVTFEFRRQSHSMTFAGVPLALGVLLIPVPALVLARLVGSVSAMVVQRTRGEKLVYNSAAFAFEAAVTSTLCWFAVPGLDPMSVLALIGCVAAMDQVMTALVLVVIRMHRITMRRREVLQVVTQSLALSAVATTFAVALRILLLRGITGYASAAVLVAVAVIGYRLYAATVRRHHIVTTFHDFVTGSATTTSMTEVAGSSLTRIRNVLRASTAELAVVNGDAGTETTSWTIFHLDEEDQLTVQQGAPAASDWVRMRALHHGTPTLALRGQDAGIDTWLDSAGPGSSCLDDAIVVPVHSGTAHLGTLTVSGRLIDIAVFTDDDVQVLQTLGGHLAASIQNARLLETLSYDATHDALTGLANRSQLMTDMASLHDDPAALLVIDVDRFKDVNDVLGHEVADELLAIVAQRLRSVTPTAHTIARVGGDEFAVLLRGSHSEGDLVAYAQGVAAGVAEPLQLHGATVSVSVSTGLAATPTVTGRDLLRCADTAMYAAKGRADRFAVYSPAMDLGRAESLALAADLRLALEYAPEQFVIYLQPKVDLRSGRAHGAEALVRWKHPTHGLIMPDRFIAIAEATGLIAPLTRHVLQAALRECAEWNAVGAPVDVAVNLSARLLADIDVVALVQDELAVAALAPERLILEITESVIMNDVEAAISILDRIAGLGVRLSLDDFGTGYSSLSYLQRLPASELKIDRSFVAALSAESSRSLSLVRSITALALDLGLELVAEGVETADQANTVAQLGCVFGQGYHYSRPMPTDHFRSWLQQNRLAALRLLPSA